MSQILSLVPPEHAQLLTRWRSALKVPGDAGRRAFLEQLFLEIIAHYGETHRRYHTIDHVKECLAVFDRIKHLIDEALHPVIEIALIYHDVIYDVTKRDNEAQSARFAATHLRDLAVPAAFIGEVGEAILGTTHKGDIPESQVAARWVADIDLSSLALPHHLFDENTERIKAEYSRHPEFSEGWWQKGQIGFFTPMFRRRTLFYTAAFLETSEDAARSNLRRLLLRYAETS